ncbi:hypothetical protein [Oceanomicrobium pacificus]|nr:hypothetical protein [Oceanomicrobium pacificus]
MARRRKSRFEQFFSLNQHRRRRGAAGVAVPEGDFAELKHKIVEAGAPAQTRGSVKDLREHLDNLRREFSGRSELEYEHARLIVLIRRGADLAGNVARFEALWAAETDFLCDSLNLRWLVSATDTFADHATDPLDRSIALTGSVLVNTVKMAESERYLTHGADAEVDPARVEHLQTELVPLPDGLSVFTVGTDDTLRNLRWRIDALPAGHSPTAIVQTMFARLQEVDSVFARFRALHWRDRTGWW